MLEKLKNIANSLTLDNVKEGFLFLLLVLSFYGIIPGITLAFAPFAILGLCVKKIYNLSIKNIISTKIA